MGRYVPPDLEGTVSFNQVSGKGHALGARARKLKTEGILTVRFELPFPIWCTTCKPEAIIGQGVRFNAEKKKVGNYYSTPIWSFRFKHTTCDGWIEVRTNPKETQYVVTEGARKRDTGEGRLAEGEIIIGASEEEKERLENEGGFGAIEKKVEDGRAANNEKARLEQLYKRSEKDWEDPYERSRALRRTFRADRKDRKAGEERAEVLKDKLSLGIDLLEETEADRLRAGMVAYGDVNGDRPVRRPLFTNQATSSVALKPITDRGKRGKKPTATEVIAEKKARLKTDLQGRTKDSADPFLDSPSSWATLAKRKRMTFEPSTDRKEDEHDNKMAAKSCDTSNVVNTSSTSLVDYDSD
ncbi:MAG: hypothetical protein Q9160_008306 [Pyrenula sp. 1 TL-2023]